MTYRDDLLAAVQERLNRVTEANDGRPVLEDGALEELRRLTDELDKDDDLTVRCLAAGFTGTG